MGVLGYGATVKYGLDNGKPDMLLRPVNFEGKLCGIGDLKEFPMLYYLVDK